MKNLETQIVINATKETVWNILMDFENYPNWNPFIQNISGNPKVKKKIRILIGLGNKPKTFKPVVLIKEDHSHFRWLGSAGIKGIFDGEHYFILEETPDGQTLLTHGENFSGILSGWIMRKIGEKTKQGFISMNEALKQKAEIK